MKRAAEPARMSCARSWPNERTATMLEVTLPLARRPAGRCLTAKSALLAGLAALIAAPVTFAEPPLPAPTAVAAPTAVNQPAATTSAAPVAAPAPTASPPPAAPPAVDEQVQSLKSDVLDLNRDLFVLEQELLYPANTQVAVFVSMDAGT